MPVKYNIISPRDIKQQSNDRFDYKLDRRQPIRAVICDEFGNDSGSGDIWYDQSKRRVWIRELGTSSASIVFCYSLTPVIGLGVLVGWRPYSNIKEVLSSDIEFLGQTNTTGTSYESPSNLDFLPGGRLQLWLQSKLIQPLATYPSTSGLVVNVVGGDYIYNGVRVTFAGQTNIDLSASQPTAGNYVFVGLYLDSANTIQTIAGASGATTPPAEPAWPTGAFRLSVVRLYNPQTKVNLKLDTDADNDIFDRRIIWTDVDSFDIWPYDKIITVSPTNAGADFATIQGADNGVTAPASVLIDPATYTETLTLDNSSMGYTGLGGDFEVTITSADATTITISNTFIALRYMTITNTNAGATATVVKSSFDDTTLEFVRILKNTGAATTSIGLHVNDFDDTGQVLRNSLISVTVGTTKYGVLMDTSAAKLLIDGGSIQGDTYDVRLNHTGATLTIQNQPRFLGGGIQVIAGQIVCDEELATTITGPYSPTSAGGSLSGKNPVESIITANQNTTDVTLTPSTSNLQFSNWTISNTGAGGAGITHECVANAQTGLILDGCSIVKTTGSSATARGFVSTGGDALLRNCKINITAGSVSNWAIYLLTAGSTVIIEGGEIAAGTIVTAHASAVLKLQGPRLGSGVTLDNSGGGTIEGWYEDSDGNTVIINGNYVYGNISGTARPNPIINGDFLIWQRGTSFAAAANATYTADKYVYNKSGAMVHTVSQSTDVPTVAQAGILTPYSLLIDCTTVDSSIAAGDFCVLNHWMEGYNFLDLAQRQFTLSFWVKATKTGTYCVAFRNAGGNRSWVAEYTVNTTATWEFKTITVSASPSAGTWDYTTGIGLGVTFTLASGSTFQTTAGAWQTGNFTATANQVNACDSTSNDFRLALINIAPGPVAPSPRLPDYQAELARCLRYAYVLDNSTNTINNGLGAKVATTLIQVQFPLPVPMRIAPTLTHNITGYTAAPPGTTTVGLVDFARNAFYNITGALTVTATANLYFGLVNFTAGTSWDGTAGNVTAARIGPSVVAVFSADF